MTQTKKQLLRPILLLLLSRGIKGLKMDLIASELSMSKRTLYELYGSKHELVTQTLDFFFKRVHAITLDIHRRSPNVVVALVEIFNLHAELLCLFALDFYHDIETLYPEIEEYYTAKKRSELDNRNGIFQQGIREGTIRSDVNYTVLSVMLDVQMDALKHIEQRLGGEFTLREIFCTVTNALMRSIVSHRGLEILESYVPRPINNLTELLLGETK